MTSCPPSTRYTVIMVPWSGGSSVSITQLPFATTWYDALTDLPSAIWPSQLPARPFSSSNAAFGFIVGIGMSSANTVRHSPSSAPSATTPWIHFIRSLPLIWSIVRPGSGQPRQSVEAASPTLVVAISSVLVREALVREHQVGLSLAIGQLDRHQRFLARRPALPYPRVRQPLGRLHLDEAARDSMCRSVRRDHDDHIAPAHAAVVFRDLGAKVVRRSHPPLQRLRLRPCAPNPLAREVERARDAERGLRRRFRDGHACSSS